MIVNEKIFTFISRFEEHMNQPIRMHNIRKRMGAMTSSTGEGVTSQEGNCKVLQNGRQVTLDEQGREVDPIELFARFVKLDSFIDTVGI